jgi:hypothetical protein
MHQLWEYCKINFTSQKTKNLVEIRESKYKQIAEDMVVLTTNTPSHQNTLPKLQHSDFLPSDEKEWLNKELANFIDTL